MKFDLCVFEVAGKFKRDYHSTKLTYNTFSGWYFGKTAGLWGTINNEPSDDFLTSQKVKAKPTDLRLFTDSWALNNCTSNLNNHVGTRPNRRIESLCKEFFLSKLSSLTTCFAKVPKDPFLKMCLNYTTEKEACSAALAYISVCSYSNTPLRIPDVCVKCSAPNGTLLDEGEFIQLNPPDLPQSADVVFIVEAKACNKDLRARKNMDSVIEALHKELTEQRLKNNRYSVVLFGGNGVYDEPRSLVVHNRVFADWQQIVPYFDSIPAGK